MTTNYDLIAQKYQGAKQQPWRTFVECFTLLQLVGDVAGKTVVNLACGEGFYTRMLRHQGAARITGIDSSQGMIELARKQEEDHHQGIEYLVQDCRDIQLAEKTDLAVAAYLLNYARTKQKLAEMGQSIARILKPGGRFVTVNSSPAFDYWTKTSYRKYGFEVTPKGELTEGTPITWMFSLEHGEVSVENYFIDLPTHEEILHSAGFRDIRWHQPQLSQEGADRFGKDFWNLFQEQPPVIFLECVK